MFPWASELVSSSARTQCSQGPLALGARSAPEALPFQQMRVTLLHRSDMPSMHELACPPTHARVRTVLDDSTAAL